MRDSEGLISRPMVDADLPGVLDLLEASMGWLPDELHARFFAWKHTENPFGASPGWVAVDEQRDDLIVGFRTFMRWQLVTGGRTVHAVRAVDTATHPDYQGRGIFSSLTHTALEVLHGSAIEFVFNTPNDRSRPGYLKMGWSEVGRLPVTFRLQSAASLGRVLTAREPASKWSLPCDAGAAAVEAFDDAAATSRLLESLTTRPGIATRRTPEFLAWRYGFEPLAYRVIFAGDSLEDGAIIFRLRARGAAKEAAITDVLVPAGDVRCSRSLARRALRESRADYAVALGSRNALAFTPVPRQGPMLVYRGIADPTQSAPSRREWAFTLGDIELF